MKQSALYLCLLFLLCKVAEISGADKLPTLNVDNGGISVSGISSGAFMATQFHVAFSSKVMGAGIIAGGPYLCSPFNACLTTPSLLRASTFISRTSSARWYNNIDDPVNLKHDRVWIFAGRKDVVINPALSNVTYAYYNHYLRSSSQIKLVNTLPAAHGMITNNYGGKCGSLLPDNYMKNCQYSAAFKLLNHIYGGNLKQPKPNVAPTGQLMQFDQTDFNSYWALMASTGYLYVPTACKNRNTKCKLHIAFHGCSMGSYLIGDVYVRHAGYNEVADLNDVIILYPQTRSSSLNQLGCWDWTGMTGIYYAFQSGPQMKAVYAMVKKLAGW